MKSNLGAIFTLVRCHEAGLALAILALPACSRSWAGPFQTGEFWIRQVHVSPGPLTSEQEHSVQRHMRLSAEYAKSVFQQIGMSLRVSTNALFVSKDAQGVPLPLGMTQSDCLELLRWYDREHPSTGVLPVFFMDHQAGNPSSTSYSEETVARLGAPKPGVFIDHPTDWVDTWRYSADTLAHGIGHVLLNRNRFAPFGAQETHAMVASALMCGGGPPLSRIRPAYQAAFDQDGARDIIDFSTVQDSNAKALISQVEGLYTGSSLVQSGTNRVWSATVHLGSYVPIEPPSAPAVVSIRYTVDASALALGTRLTVPVIRIVQELVVGSPAPVTRTESTGVTAHLSAWSRRQTESTVELCVDLVVRDLSSTGPPSGFRPAIESEFDDPASLSLGSLADTEIPTQTRVWIQNPTGDGRALGAGEYALDGLTTLVLEKGLLGGGTLLRWTFAIKDEAAALLFGGDMNGDGAFNLDDILRLAARSGEEPSLFDMTGDGRVSLDDVQKLLVKRIRSKLGDANLNGLVNPQDLDLCKTNWLANGNWPNGDFDGDRLVCETDLAILSANWEATPVRWQGYPITRHIEVASAAELTRVSSLVWLSVLDDRYQVETSTDLRQWSNLGQPVWGTGEWIHRWIPAAWEQARFFRLTATDSPGLQLRVGAATPAFRVIWASDVANSYQVQRWLPLDPQADPAWENSGDPVPGVDAPLEQIVPIGFADPSRAACRVLLVP